jgi:toxin ParE1/3/4
MSRYQLAFHPDISIDYDSAYSWYEDQRSGLGEKFLRAVREKIDAISEHPETYSERARFGYHEAVVKGFPYTIVYKLYKKEKKILVVSIHHQKRHPRHKYRR